MLKLDSKTEKKSKQKQDGVTDTCSIVFIKEQCTIRYPSELLLSSEQIRVFVNLCVLHLKYFFYWIILSEVIKGNIDVVTN